MTKMMRALIAQPETHDIIERARRRDNRYGSGDVYDFALFVIDETRKADRRKRAVVDAHKVKP